MNSIVELRLSRKPPKSIEEKKLNLKQTSAAVEQFLADVVSGLSQKQKTLPCKYFYDQRGSKLFDQICELEEYYLTRTEQAIMDRYAAEMAEQLGSGVKLLELGSGSSTKTEVLLEHLIDPAAYVPIDISKEHLLATAKTLRTKFPLIEILPVVADFTKPLPIPNSKITASHNAVYFPGSTIGNFTPELAQKLLKNIASNLGPDGGLLIGFDLQKPAEIIEAAYNDAAGVTAEFNLNLLRRMNRELDTNFDLDQFEHQAVYDSRLGRIEMHLVSMIDQTVTVGDQTFDFEADESILTEYSHKYTFDGFEKIANTVGFAGHRRWSDDKNRFGVMHLVLETEQA